MIIVIGCVVLLASYLRTIILYRSHLVGAGSWCVVVGVGYVRY